ncbi:hypothetical protein MHU86_21836 [Fragilaria crotonensis]|nr:hypothetical protein MHU86_21836 [Fragilaria crotonensis]
MKSQIFALLLSILLVTTNAFSIPSQMALGGVNGGSAFIVSQRSSAHAHHNNFLTKSAPRSTRERFADGFHGQVWHLLLSSMWPNWVWETRSSTKFVVKQFRSTRKQLVTSVHGWEPTICAQS